MKLAKLSIETIDYIIENITLDEGQSVSLLLELKDQIKTEKAVKEKADTVDTFKKLWNYQKGKTVDYGCMPDSLKDYRECIYDYEKGVDTDLDRQVEKFCETLEDSEFELVWNEEKKDYNYEELAKLMDLKYPGIIKYLIENKIKTIRFYW